MRRAGRGRSGFTLVELMITVAIVGILAAIAVPRFEKMYLRAKRAEAYPNLKGIAVAEIAHEGAYDSYVTASSNPGPPLNKQAKEWDRTDPDWQELGWEPDGPVRCTYAVTAYGGDTWFRADAYCDVDDDNRVAIIRYYSDQPGGDPAHFVDLYPNRF